MSCASRTSLADTGSVEVAVGPQQSALSIRPTVLHTGADGHLRHHGRQRPVPAAAAVGTPHIQPYNAIAQHFLRGRFRRLTWSRGAAA